MTSTEAEDADRLLTPEAVRLHCGEVFRAGLAGELEHFRVDMGRLGATADAVCQTIRTNYPSLAVPPHARWRHFVVEGRDRWGEIAAGLVCDAAEHARIACELAITSVLLDAGAGASWRYRDKTTGSILARSEGLAIASLDLYASGGFSARAETPLRADASRLAAFDSAQLAEAFHVDADNPLDGAAGRALVIRRLGEQVAAMPKVFGDEARLGNIADYLASLAHNGGLEARSILITILNALGPIWPGRVTLAGRNLGDTWRHRAAGGRGLVPFHKLSQWLSYSLIEPLQHRGIRIIGTEALTGLAEYRNGGLFIDSGVLALRNASAASLPHDAGSELVVEWRALTVCLLDEIAPLVRNRLGRTEAELELASILEGGTWATGRRLAAQLRPGGPPPISILSDGSVF